MTARLQATAVLTLLLVAALAYPDCPVDPLEPAPAVLTADEVAAGIAWFVRAAPRSHPLALNTELARKRAQRIAEVSATYGIPSSLTLAIAIRESGIRISAVDPMGAKGLMQVSPCNVAKLRCDMRTASGQLHCGCRVLRMGFDKCRSWRGAITYYASKAETCRAERGTKLYWVARDRLKLAREITDEVRQPVR